MQLSAMTRTKAWLHISASGHEGQLVIEELKTICSDMNSCLISAQVPHPDSVRILESEEDKSIRQNMKNVSNLDQLVEFLDQNPEVLK